MPITRQPAVAGTFYPANPQTLRQTINQFLDDATPHLNLPPPKALISPHAGYIYSGPIAASAYACLKNAKNKLKNIVIAAPAHRYPFSGIAIPTVDSYSTPLGQVPINKEALTTIEACAYVNKLDVAAATEHAIEVQLPFLQVLLNDFMLIPLLVGNAASGEVATVLQKLWGNDETLIIISSDLSHYLPYAKAKLVDAQAAAAILALDPLRLKADMACGHQPIRGLLTIAAQKKLHATQIDLRNSGDTAGSKEQVVGYGAFHFGNNL